MKATLLLLICATAGCQPPEPKRNHVTFATSADGTICWRLDHTRYEAWVATIADPTWRHIREDVPLEPQTTSP